MKRLRVVTLALLAAGCIDWAGARDEYCASGFHEGCPGQADGGSDGGDVDAGDVDAGDVDAGDVDAGDVDAGGTDAGGADAGPATITFVIEPGDAGASGRIEWMDGGSVCDVVASPCRLDVARGSELALRGEPGKWSVLTGFAGCSTPEPLFGRCALAVQGDATVTASFDRPNLVFVTAAGYPLGTFSREPDGGTGADVVSKADAICADLAADAGLPGTFVALVGRGAHDPLATSLIGGGRGWIRVDGKPVFDDLATPGAIAAPFYPPALSERGGSISISERVGTGMSRGGGVCTTRTCNDFNSTQGSIHLCSGYAHLGGASWFDDGPNTQTGCGGLFHLACFGIDRRVPVRVDRSRPTRLAFVTAAPFIPGDGGLVAADEQCDAEAASRYGSDAGFSAYLYAGPLLGPTTRLTSSEVPWARADGVVVVPAPSVFITSQAVAGPQAPLSNDDTARFWVGADNNTCFSWTSNTANQVPQGGRAWVSGPNWATVPNGLRCTDTIDRLACFER